MRPYTPGVRFALPRGNERLELLAILGRPPAESAPRLLGQLLVRRRGRGALAVRIVETEAYLGADDPAAHAFRGRTPRTEPLFGPPGTLYVYLIYGMHHCLNLAVQERGLPGCVLIRAAEPVGDVRLETLRGPGRLCRALGIDTRLSGLSLFDGKTGLTLRRGEPPAKVLVSPRIGIRRAVERELRFRSI